MKKSLIVLLSVMVVMAFAASAFALHQVKTSEYTPGLVKSGKSQIELGGEIRIRGNYSKNSDFNDDAWDNEQKYDQRVRLSTKANVTDKTMGLVELETGTSGSTYNWGDSSNTKSKQLSIRQAYISHQFGTIGGIKAGKMLFALGNRLFFDHSNYGDDAILGWVAAGPGEVSLTSLKLAEGNTRVNDDTNAYALAVEMPIDAINVSGDITYIHSSDKSTYNDGTQLINIGLRADADLKVVKVKADVEVQTGKDKTAATAPTEVKYSGLATMLGAEANVGPATVRGGFAYGTGDKSSTADKQEGFQTFLTDNQYYTFIYDYSVIGAAATSATDLGNGLANTMYVTVGASVKPIADLKVSMDAYLLRASKEVSLNGAAASKKLGYEIDGKVEYQIASNLAYYVEAGILLAGEAYDFSAAKDADDPYRVRHGVLLKF